MILIAAFITWIVVFMFFFFVLSLIGLLWCDSYREIITDGHWFAIYAMFVGWWIATIPIIEIFNPLIK